MIFHKKQQQQHRPPGETVQERLITAAASTGLLFRKGISETKEKVAVGKVKVEEVFMRCHRNTLIFYFYTVVSTAVEYYSLLPIHCDNLELRPNTM